MTSEVEEARKRQRAMPLATEDSELAGAATSSNAAHTDGTAAAAHVGGTVGAIAEVTARRMHEPQRSPFKAATHAIHEPKRSSPLKAPPHACRTTDPPSALVALLPSSPPLRPRRINGNSSPMITSSPLAAIHPMSKCSPLPRQAEHAAAEGGPPPGSPEKRARRAAAGGSHPTRAMHT